MREAFDARRMIEAGLAMFLAPRLTEFEIAALGAAAADGQRPANGRAKEEAQNDFHLQLAKLARTGHIDHTLRELLSRTSSLAQRASGVAPWRGHREHEHVVAALKERTDTLAAELLTPHLSTMETRLRPPEEAAALNVSVSALVQERLREHKSTLGRPKTVPRSAVSKRA